MWNLIRWVSPRTIKETFVPPRDYRYPFMDARQRRGLSNTTLTSPERAAHTDAVVIRFLKLHSSRA